MAVDKKAYYHAYHLANKERRAANAARSRANNRERVAENRREWRVKNPEREKYTQWKSDLKRHYGLTPEDYEALFDGQSGCCPICGLTLPEGKNTHVDHDHKTGVVRGLLCHHCNMLLGQARDSKEVLRAAIAYLESAEGRSPDVINR